MKNGEIINILERFAPPQIAEEWDNVGLMLGSRERENTGVVVALDLTKETLELAKEKGANMIVTHHPFIFGALSRVDEDEARGELIARLIRDEICVYSAHTNLDKTKGGINDRLVELFGGEDVEEDGIGRIFRTGDLTLRELARRVADRLGDGTVRVAGDLDKKIGRAYVVSGAGASEYERAREKADALITGEIKHHQYIEANLQGFCLVEFSHYFSEIVAEKILCDLLKSYPIKTYAAANVCPFRRIEEL